MNVQKKALLLTALVSATAFAPCLQAATWTETAQVSAKNGWNWTANTAKTGWSKSADLARTSANKIKESYNISAAGIKNGARSSLDYAKNNKYKTAAIVVGATTVAVTIFYFAKNFFKSNPSKIFIGQK